MGRSTNSMACGFEAWSRQTRRLARHELRAHGNGRYHAGLAVLVMPHQEDDGDGTEAPGSDDPKPHIDERRQAVFTVIEPRVECPLCRSHLHYVAGSEDSVCCPVCFGMPDV